MKHKPVKHLADCDICFVMNDDGYQIRVKAICKKCKAYPKCIASKTDRIMGEVLHSINKLKLY